jgi:hypothetical protein
MNTCLYAEKKFAEINGVRMAYLDEGRAVQGGPGLRCATVTW